ncbi:MAG: hypothetical protein ACREXU_16830 [Gammaproteobacteria bacterium]
MTELPAIDIDVAGHGERDPAPMTLKHDVETLLDREEHAGTPLAEYLGGCLHAYEPDSWQAAVAIRAEWNRRYPQGGPK